MVRPLSIGPIDPIVAITTPVPGVTIMTMFLPFILRVVLVLGLAALICSIGGFWPTVGLVWLGCFLVS